jgi:Holliday junction DNA helicase RuvA
MIGRLTGKLLGKEPPLLWLDVNGVGYELEAPLSTFYKLPEAGQGLSLHTHLIVREDAQTLVGFASAAEKSLFRQLIRLSGVGPKSALTILSGISVDDFWETVRAQDSAKLTRLPGIGKKTAERLVLELKEKLPRLAAAGPNKGTPLAPGASNAERLLAALTNMGYRPSEGERALKALGDKLDTLPLSESLREALRHLTP